MAQTMKRTQKDTEAFEIYEKTIPGGARFPLHWHDYLEFELIVSGEGEHIYNGTAYTVRQGSAYLMYYHDFHEMTARTQMKLYSLHFDKALISPEISQYLDFNKFHCSLSQGEYERLLRCIRELVQEAAQERLLRQRMAESIISQIVITMVRNAPPVQARSLPLPVQKAVAYMHENFRRDITLEGTAAILSFTPNYLGQLMKAQTGSSFNEYLQLLRLKYACGLLTGTTLTVKEVAFASGYRSVEYFQYVFKQKMRMTPNVFRNQRRALWP